jgi:DNA-binding XRE family transcriptional regulator
MLKNKLREVRTDIGMSVSELSRRAGVSRMTITNIELHNSTPSGDVLIRLSDVLRADPRDIFFIEDVSQNAHSVIS